MASLPIFDESRVSLSRTAPPITSLLIKPASAVCNLDCEYCFYLDRDADPYKELPARQMTIETLERLVDTYLFYSYPRSSFIFQGGEPTLAGLPFFEKLIEFQKRYGRNGQSVSNALQTNGTLLDENWCRLLREYNWFVGLSLDGPPETNDRYRYNKDLGQGNGDPTPYLDEKPYNQRWSSAGDNIATVVRLVSGQRRGHQLRQR